MGALIIGTLIGIYAFFVLMGSIIGVVIQGEDPAENMVETITFGAIDPGGWFGGNTYPEGFVISPSSAVDEDVENGSVLDEIFVDPTTTPVTDEQPSQPSREGIQGPHDGARILESYIVYPNDPAFEGTVKVPDGYWVVTIGTEVRMDGISGKRGVLTARPSGTYNNVRVKDGSLAIVREDYAPQYLCEQRGEWGVQPTEDFPSDWDC